MPDPNYNDDQQYLQIRKKHLVIGVFSALGIVALIFSYLVHIGLSIGFNAPVSQAEPLSAELIARFEQIENKFNAAIEQFNELELLKQKLNSPNSPKSKSTPNSPNPAKEPGQGGVPYPLPQLNFNEVSYRVDESFASMHTTLEMFEQHLPLLKSLLTMGLYKNSNLPRGVPLLGEYIFSSGFGIRSDPFTMKDEFHTGLDFAAEIGTPVVAAEPGIVLKTTKSQDRLGLGNAIEIMHANGISTKYGHLDKILVKPNQKVQRGEIIGSVGNTGRSTGPHLHFEVSIAGTPVDPISGKSAIPVKPSPVAMAAVNAESKSRCADLLLIVVDENAPLMKECLRSGGLKAKDLLISRFQNNEPRTIKDKNQLMNPLLNDCTYVDQDQKLQSSTRSECRSGTN